MEQKNKNELDQALPDIAEKFAPGELVADEGHGPEYLKSQYGNQLEELPLQYQEQLRKLCQKIALRDMFARMDEVRKATEQRFYWRGDFDTCWDDSQQTWAQPGLGSPFRNESDTGDVSLSYPLNIYQQKGREHISLISKIPGVRFEAKGLRPNAMKVAADADAMRCNIETINPMEQWVQDAARYSWTDSCVCFYQRWVTDGSRFGYKEEHHDNEEQNGTGGGGDPPSKRPREPKGGEMSTPYGVLECKRPINMRNKADFPFIQLAFEIDSGSAKSLYPWYAKKLTGGQPGPGEYNYDRTCRLAVTQGVRLLTEAGDTTQELPTWQRTWIRPSMFSEIEEDEDREFFEDNFPDGAFVAFVGDTYCESRNESLDDHWEIWHPLPGDGQATPSCGEIILPVQDAVNDMCDLLMERAMKGIPAIWCSKDAVDIQAIGKQKAGPGAHYPLKSGLDPTIPAGNYFFPEPTPQGGEQEAAMLSSLFTDIPEALTGLSPAALGADEDNNPTFGGQKLRQDAAKGQSGLAWRSLRETYSRIMYQLVRIGSYYRSADVDDEGLLALSLPEQGEVYIDLEDLHEGNFWCFADGDESYPRTHADIADAVQSLLAAATKNPALQPLVALPKNMVIFKDAIGLSEMEIPGADIEEKQLGQIDRMLKEPPVPNMQTRQQFALATAAAALTGQPPPPPPPFSALWNPIIKIQPEDDNTAMVTVIKNWLNSPEGCQQDEDNPDGTAHVRLLLAQRQPLAQQDAQQAQQQAMLPELLLEKAKHSGQQKTPAESINFKDLGESGKIQVGAQAGLDLRADAASDAAHETIEDSTAQPPPGGKPNGAAQPTQ